MLGRDLRLNLLRLAATAVLSIGLAGCETPRHSNTLIFGTSTKFALDASQEPTGSLGLTLGYKRNEAVWMPLIANEADPNNKLVPAKCGSSAADCLKFEGGSGKGGAAGEGAKDTYSVLATFSGNVATSAQNPQAKGAVAQYFATGLAARLLAQVGGAALVNTEAPPASAANPAAAASAAAAAIAITRKADSVVAKVSKTTGAIDEAAVKKLLDLSPASEISAVDKDQIKAQKSAPALAELLKDAPPSVVERLYKTIDQL